MIVAQYQSIARPYAFSSGGKGASTVMVVPAPSADSMANEPCTRRARRHADQAQSAASFMHIKSLAEIFNLEAYAGGNTGKRYLHMRFSNVLRHVARRFLRDAIKNPSRFVRNGRRNVVGIPSCRRNSSSRDLIASAKPRSSRIDG
jgi:hypothetical protein